MSRKTPETTPFSSPIIKIGTVALCAVALIAIGVAVTDRPTGDTVGVENAPDLIEVETEFESSITEQLPVDAELSGPSVTPDDTDVFVTPVVE